MTFLWDRMNAAFADPLSLLAATSSRHAAMRIYAADIPISW